MTRPISFHSGPVWLAAVGVVAATGLAIPQAQATVFPPASGNSGTPVGFTGRPHSPSNLLFNNSTVIGNIEIGAGIDAMGNLISGGFVGTAPGTVTGTVNFAAPNAGQFQPNGVTVIGGATFNNPTVQPDLNALSGLSQNLRNDGGTPLLIAGGGSVNVSSGVPNESGNEVFTATIASSFIAGTTFTINGTSSQSVVFNTTTGGLPFNGRIILTGGITSDQVLFNFDAGNFDTNTGGDPLIIDTNFNPTTGTYLDPNGPFQITDTLLNGRIYGGDSLDSGITNSTIVAPTQVSEPPSLALLGAGLLAFGIIRRQQSRLRSHSCDHWKSFPATLLWARKAFGFRANILRSQ